jgi:hypothetical protein
MIIYRMCSNLETQEIEWIKIDANGQQMIAPAYVHAGNARREFYEDVKPVTFD